MIRMSECVPRQQTATRYHRMRLVNKCKMIICISRNRVCRSHMANESINQSINHEISYVGPPPKPILFLHELVSQIPIFWNYENSIHAYIKSRETEDYLKPEEN